MPADAHRIPPAQDIQGSQYQLDIHMKLRDSGLAERIAAGPDALPWIYDYYSNWSRSLAEEPRPQSPAQLAVHVMRHLEWYLEAPKPVRPNPVQRTRAWLIRLAAVGLAALCLMLVALAWIGGLTLPSKLVIGAMAALGVYLLIRGVQATLAEDARHDIRCAVFYDYLVDTYTDSENG